MIGKFVLPFDRVNLREAPGLSAQVVGWFDPTSEPIKILGGPARVDNIYWWNGEHDGVSVWFAQGMGSLDFIAEVGDNFERALHFIFRVEGILSTDRMDPGNWTGGKVGVGEFKGSKFGISAASYPDLDIENLTKDDAAAIYLRDFWYPAGCDKLAWPLVLAVFDAAVQHGPLVSVGYLKDGESVMQYIAARLHLYTTLPNWPRYGGSWVRRMAMLLEACASTTQG